MKMICDSYDSKLCDHAICFHLGVHNKRGNCGVPVRCGHRKIECICMDYTRLQISRDIKEILKFV